MNELSQPTGAAESAPTTSNLPSTLPHSVTGVEAAGLTTVEVAVPQHVLDAFPGYVSTVAFQGFGVRRPTG